MLILENQFSLSGSSFLGEIRVANENITRDKPRSQVKLRSLFAIEPFILLHSFCSISTHLVAALCE